MLIRHADPARDAAACAAIYEPYVRDSVSSLEEEAPDTAEMTRRIEAVSASYPWLVAEDAGTIRGYAYAARHRTRAAYRWAVDAAVYVDDAHRGGIGRSLYEPLLDLLARQGLRVVCAGITLPNDASVALHESFGFQPVGVYPRIGFKQNRWWDVGWWALELAGTEGGPPREPGPPARLGGTASEDRPAG
jgi:phosphinothricin acetyltransferase